MYIHNVNCRSLSNILNQRNIIIFHLAEKTSIAKEKAFNNAICFCFVTEKGYTRLYDSTCTLTETIDSLPMQDFLNIFVEVQCIPSRGQSIE